jgi:hypothetical protein
MPAVSRNQRIATAIAEHAPDKLYARNRGLLGMSHNQLHHFASTPQKGLPVSKESMKTVVHGRRKKLGMKY